MSAYEQEYLNSVKKVTRFLFHQFMYHGYDYFACVKEYMRSSEIRKKMDDGNWSALNKGVKQLYNSINYVGIPQGKNIYMDEIMSDWLADVYVYLQWKYNISSSQIIERLPPENLMLDYDPLHETNLSNACDKLFKRYWSCYDKGISR